MTTHPEGLTGPSEKSLELARTWLRAQVMDMGDCEAELTQSLGAVIECARKESDEAGFTRGYAQALEDTGAVRGLVKALNNRAILKEAGEKK